VTLAIAFLEAAKEAGGRAGTPRALVGGLHGAVEEVEVSGVGPATGRADHKGLVMAAALNGVAQAEAAAALGEGRMGIKALDFDKLAKERGGAAAEDIEADTVRVVEAIDDTGMSFVSEGGGRTEPLWGHEGVAADAGCTLEELLCNNLRGDWIPGGITLERDVAKEDVAEASSRGSMAVRAEGVEVKGIKLRQFIHREFGGEGEDEVAADLLGGPTAREEVDGGGHLSHGGLDLTDNTSRVEASPKGGVGRGGREGLVPGQGCIGMVQHNGGVSG